MRLVLAVLVTSVFACARANVPSLSTPKTAPVASTQVKPPMPKRTIAWRLIQRASGTTQKTLYRLKPGAALVPRMESTGWTCSVAAKHSDRHDDIYSEYRDMACISPSGHAVGTRVFCTQEGEDIQSDTEILVLMGPGADDGIALALSCGDADMDPGTTTMPSDDSVTIITPPATLTL